MIDLGSQNNIDRPVTLAIDAMGGDNSPEKTIGGIKRSAKKNPNINYLIFGDKEKVQPLLDKCKISDSRYQLIHTSEAIADEEKPSQALRKGRNSSMFLAIKAVKEKKADAIISAGNTGALMAFSKITLQTLPGIDRPAIGGLMPTRKGLVVMLDLGANIHSDAENLFEFAIMGEAFARAVLGVKEPKVAMLNVGSERNKGHEVLKTAYTMLEENALKMNFVGYAEGDDIFSGDFDVIVTDGFNGNISLKTAEGMAKFYTHILKKNLKSSLFGLLGSVVALPALYSIKKSMDPRNYNGAMFLGLNGIVVKSHGSTDDIGFANAIEVGYKLIKNNVNADITSEMISSGHVPPAPEDDAPEINL